MNIRVILADDHVIMREGLRRLLESQPGIEVVAEVGDGRNAVKKAKELRPDVVIIDIGMPDLNGIEAARQIMSSIPRVKIIGLSMHSEKQFIVEMLRAGASAYLLKDCASQELVQAIREALVNRIYLSPSIADDVIRSYIHDLPDIPLSPYSVLTAREREVLQLLAEGKSIKEISKSLYVSVKTIETHKQNIMEKLNIHNIAGLTKYAVVEGLTTLDT
jgi:DNA-binding NarL/FixJ family response regulator